MSDADLIEQLGGPTKLAAELGYPLPRGVARVSNWKVRGIPPAVRVQRPDLFMRHLMAQQPAAAAAEGGQHAAA